MKQAFKKIGLICIVLVFLPFISFLPLQLNQKQLPQTNARNVPSSERLDEEIFKPSNWIARGGCWDFSKKIFTAQGVGQRPIAYFKRENYADFKFEIRLRLLTDEDGSYGMVFRFDEKMDVGYIFGVWPQGNYEFARLDDCFGYQTGGGQAVYLKDQLKTWNRLKVVAKGTKFDLYINDNLLVTIEDNSFKSGKVGFYLGHGPQSQVEYEILYLVAQ
ncbi:MAG TPA: family 16 glycoside hydrolase [bacterium]